MRHLQHQSCMGLPWHLGHDGQLHGRRDPALRDHVVDERASTPVARNFAVGGSDDLRVQLLELRSLCPLRWLHVPVAHNPPGFVD
eukprot:9204237-Pyramimonas_sp.AAC.1